MGRMGRIGRMGRMGRYTRRDKRAKIKLSIVIPAKNEEKRIGRALRAYVDYFGKKVGRGYEILVVVNNSTDRTFDVVSEVSSKNRGVRCVNIGSVEGKGEALIKGFGMCNGEFIGFVDADGATAPESYFKLYEELLRSGVDGVIASRWSKGSIVRPRQKLMRRIASRGFNMLVRGMFFLNYDDTQTGAKIFKMGAINSVLNDLQSTGWAFDVDLLYSLKRRGFIVREIPIVWADISGSKLNLKRVVLEMLVGIVRLRLVYSPFSFVVTAYNRLADIIKGFFDLF